MSSKEMQKKLIVVADDFTRANGTGVQFKKAFSLSEIERIQLVVPNEGDGIFRDYDLSAIRRIGRDPRGGTLQLKIIPLLVSLAGSFCFYNFLKLRLESYKNKIPPASLRE